MSIQLFQDAKFRWLLFSGILVGILEILSFFKISLPVPWGAIFYSLLILVVGWDTLLKGLKALVNLNFQSINLLVFIAASGAFFLRHYEEAAVVIVLFSLAEHLERVGVQKSKSSLDTLLNQIPKQALLIKEGLTDVSKIKIDDLIRIKPGQIIPLDGTVIEGASFVDESTITGEPIPQDKRVGDLVYAGTLNNQGVLDVKVTKGFQDTSLAKIREMAFKASKYKSETQRFIEKFSSIYTPMIIFLALIWMTFPPLLFAKPFLESFYQALSLLVIACPCALVISTPIAIFSAIGKASQKGILIKGGKFLEAMGQLKAIAFDKTRTLTIGKPIVSDVLTFNKATKETLLACAAGIEYLSEHPLAASIVDAARAQNITLHPVENFESFMGKGARADCLVCYDKHHCIGKLQFILEEHEVPKNVIAEVEKLQEAGKSAIVVSTHREVEGIIALHDEIREESARVSAELKNLKITCIMLTGDHSIAAKVVANKLGIDEVHAELLPQDKAHLMQELVKKYKIVAMVGDGINDAPALASASVGISMAGLGSDTALEAASIVLLNDRLTLIPYLVRLGRKTLSMIRFNTFFAIIFKVAIVLLALMGMANLALAILADVGVTIFVILNSLRLTRD